MLVHECVECNTLSINRIAADDDSESIVAVFQDSGLCDVQLRYRCMQFGIEMLGTNDTETIFTQLYGHGMEVFI